MRRTIAAIAVAGCFMLFSASWVCAQGHEANALPDGSDSKTAQKILQMPAATAEQIAAHPWLVDPTLPEKVSAVSRELGQIIAIDKRS